MTPSAKWAHPAEESFMIWINIFAHWYKPRIWNRCFCSFLTLKKNKEYRRMETLNSNIWRSVFCYLYKFSLWLQKHKKPGNFRNCQKIWVREEVFHTLNKISEQDCKLEFRAYSLGFRLTVQSAEAGVLSELLLLRSCSEFWIMTARNLALSRLGRWWWWGVFPLFVSEYCWLPEPPALLFSFTALSLVLWAFFLFFSFLSSLKFFQLEQPSIS